MGNFLEHTLDTEFWSCTCLTLRSWDEILKRSYSKLNSSSAWAGHRHHLDNYVLHFTTGEIEEMTEELPSVWNPC